MGNLKCKSAYSTPDPKIKIDVRGSLTGDNFPSTEAFIIPEGSDTKVFLGVGQ